MLSAPEPLGDAHHLDLFRSGSDTLDEWLRRRARANQASGASRTYVLAEDRRVVGYYCLASGALDLADAPGPVRRNMPDPIPVMVLGRLAVDRAYQNQRVGKALLREAILRVLQASEIAGIKAILVHAISEEARQFYLRHGFVESPVQPMTLCLALDSVRQGLAR